jgi:hypothetical protein
MKSLGFVSLGRCPPRNFESPLTPDELARLGEKAGEKFALADADARRMREVAGSEAVAQRPYNSRAA